MDFDGLRNDLSIPGIVFLTQKLLILKSAIGFLKSKIIENKNEIFRREIEYLKVIQKH